MIIGEDTAWFKKAVAEIPGDSGWWHDSGFDEFMVLAVELSDKGLDRYEVLDFLTRTYWIVANEFGL